MVCQCCQPRTPSELTTVCFRNRAALCFFFSSLFHNPANARYRLSPSLVSKSDQFLAGIALYNYTVKFRNRDFPPLFFFKAFLPCRTIFIMAYVMAGVLLPHLLNAGSIWGHYQQYNPSECLYQQRWQESQLASLEFPFVREIPWELQGLYNNSLILEYFPI